LQFHEWWIKTIKFQYPKIDEKIFIFGLLTEFPGINLYNNFILIIKYHIFLNKAGTIGLEKVLRVFQSTQKIENQIAMKNRNIERYLEKWKIYLK
jgi:hypothetical protein